MSQTWNDNVFDPNDQAASDLQSIEDNFAALKSNFSGGTGPAGAIAGTPWFDTTKKLLKHRNNANGAWRGIMAGSPAFKIWVYLAAIEDGWAIDSGIADKILAIKSASGSYATAGAAGGTWTITNGAHAHTTSGLTLAIDNYQGFYAIPGGKGGQDTYPVFINRQMNAATGKLGYVAYGTQVGGAVYTYDVYYSLSAGNTGSIDIGSSGAWRPSASVGLVMYPDV